MSNLDIERAKSAFDQAQFLINQRNARGDDQSEGDAVSGFAGKVIANGLIATVTDALASCKDEPKEIVLCLAEHLREFSTTQSFFEDPIENGVDLQSALMNGDSARLRAATHEALAFLSYLKRFVKITHQENSDDHEA